MLFASAERNVSTARRRGARDARPLVEVLRNQRAYPRGPCRVKTGAGLRRRRRARARSTRTASPRRAAAPANAASASSVARVARHKAGPPRGSAARGTRRTSRSRALSVVSPRRRGANARCWSSSRIDSGRTGTRRALDSQNALSSARSSSAYTSHPATCAPRRANAGTAPRARRRARCARRRASEPAAARRAPRAARRGPYARDRAGAHGDDGGVRRPRRAPPPPPPRAPPHAARASCVPGRSAEARGRVRTRTPRRAARTRGACVQPEGPEPPVRAALGAAGRPRAAVARRRPARRAAAAAARESPGGGGGAARLQVRRAARGWPAPRAAHPWRVRRRAGHVGEVIVDAPAGRRGAPASGAATRAARPGSGPAGMPGRRRAPRGAVLLPMLLGAPRRRVRAARPSRARPLAAACSMSEQPSSRLSAAASARRVQRLRGGAVARGHGAGLLQQRSAAAAGHRTLERLAHVTSASEPASELTIRCCLRSRASGSTAKSFSTSSRAGHARDGHRALHHRRHDFPHRRRQRHRRGAPAPRASPRAGSAPARS